MTEKEYTVPLIDSETGEEWDETVEAETPQKAIQEAVSDYYWNVHVSSTFVREHLEIQR